GVVFRQRLRAMGIRDKPTAPRSPWQNPYVERLIGTIRRECLDHMIVFGEAHLRRILGRYAAYYNETRIHRWTRMPHSTGRLSASASSHHSLSSAAFITNIAESDFRHAQPAQTLAMPAHDSLGPDDAHGIQNAGIATIEPDEQGAVDPTQMQPTAWRALLQDVELMPQYYDFGFQPRSRLEEVAQHTDEQEADCNHPTILF